MKKKSFIFIIFLSSFFCCNHHLSSMKKPTISINFSPFSKNKKTSATVKKPTLKDPSIEAEINISPLGLLVKVLNIKYIQGALISTFGIIVADSLTKLIINRIKKEEIRKLRRNNYLPPSSQLSIILSAAYGAFLASKPDLAKTKVVLHIAFISFVLGLVYTLYRLAKELITLNKRKRYGILKNVVNGVKQILLNAGSLTASYACTCYLKKLNYDLENALPKNDSKEEGDDNEDEEEEEDTGEEDSKEEDSREEDSREGAEYDDGGDSGEEEEEGE